MYIKFHLNVPGANELMCSSSTWMNNYIPHEIIDVNIYPCHKIRVNPRPRSWKHCRQWLWPNWLEWEDKNFGRIVTPWIHDIKTDCHIIITFGKVQLTAATHVFDVILVAAIHNFNIMNRSTHINLLLEWEQNFSYIGFLWPPLLRKLTHN